MCGAGCIDWLPFGHVRPRLTTIASFWRIVWALSRLHSEDRNSSRFLRMIWFDLIWFDLIWFDGNLFNSECRIQFLLVV
jgi:hypothetical protein